MADEASLRKIFEEFDSDKSGHIDMKEIKKMVKAYYKELKMKADDDQIKDTCYELMKNLDKDCDGKISMKEWLVLKTSGSPFVNSSK